MKALTSAQALALVQRARGLALMPGTHVRTVGVTLLVCPPDGSRGMPLYLLTLDGSTIRVLQSTTRMSQRTLNRLLETAGWVNDPRFVSVSQSVHPAGSARRRR